MRRVKEEGSIRKGRGREGEGGGEGTWKAEEREGGEGKDGGRKGRSGRGGKGGKRIIHQSAVSGMN